MIDPADKEEFESLVPREALLLGAGDMPSRQCLRWAVASVRVLGRLGYRAVLNAGTAAFVLVSDEADDGVKPNQLEFRWSIGRDAFEAWQKIDILPEMHCWAALPDVGELGVIVDPTARFRSSWARQIGLKFDLPEVRTLWASPQGLPDGFYYRAEWDACKFAHEAARKILKKK